MKKNNNVHNSTEFFDSDSANLKQTNSPRIKTKTARTNRKLFKERMSWSPHRPKSNSSEEYCMAELHESAINSNKGSSASRCLHFHVHSSSTFSSRRNATEKQKKKEKKNEERRNSTGSRRKRRKQKARGGGDRFVNPYTRHHSRRDAIRQLTMRLTATKWSSDAGRTKKREREAREGRIEVGKKMAGNK